MSYQVLARKWRPHRFSEMVGQTHVLTSLIHSLDQNRLHHAYLFTGSRGVGKTSVARIMAKCLNCETGVTSHPCGECQACQEIDQGRFIDLIEIDAASRTKVEDTREILDNVQYAPTKGRFKVYLIDEVHMLSTHSFNALLKTLEEPPAHVKFLLATTEPKKLPVTVLSRCLQFYLKNISQPDMIERLSEILTKENIAFETSGLQLISRAATGSLRDALSLLDQAIAYGDGSVKTTDCQQMLGMTDDQILIDIATALVTQDGDQVKGLLANLESQSTDFMVLLDSLSRLFYEISVAQVLPTMDHFEFDKQAVHDLAKEATKTQIQLLYQIAIKAKQDLPWAPDLKTGFEMALLRMYAFMPMELSQAPVQQPNTAATIRIQNDDVVAPSEKDYPVKSGNDGVGEGARSPAVNAPSPSLNAPSSSESNAPSSSGLTGGSSSEFNWLTVSSQLPLLGMAKQVVAHCSMRSMEGDKLVLALEPQHAQVLSEGLTKKIEDAVQKYTGRPVKLTIEVSEQAVQTPAKVTQKAVDDRQQQAQDAIAQDELANYIQSQFNASADPNSIKPIEKENKE